MNTPDDTQLARVRALLAKAEDPAATAAEAEAYTAKAVELMAKYGVDRAMLAAADPTTDVVGDRVITISGTYAKDKQHLASQIALALGCKTVLLTRYEFGNKVYKVHFFGYGSDLDRAEMLFTSLLVQAAHAVTAERVPWGENPAAYRRSWLAGYTAMVARRLHAAEQHAQRAADTSAASAGGSGPSVALVLADRSALVKSRVDDAYPKLGKARDRQLSGSGYHDGVDAGRKANLGGTAVRAGERRQVSA